MSNQPAKGAPAASSGPTLVWSQHSFRILTAAAVLLIVIGTVAYHLLEDWSWVDSFYFSVVAISTVGFGDLSPSTDGSKLFTVVYIVLGVGIVTMYLNERFKYRASERAERR